MDKTCVLSFLSERRKVKKKEAAFQNFTLVKDTPIVSNDASFARWERSARLRLARDAENF